MRSSVASATCSSLPERRMRILVITSHYPPAVTGGYERECAAAVGHLRREHEVVVLTSRRSRRLSPAEPNLRRVLPVLPGGWRGSLMAPAVTRRAATLVGDDRGHRPGSDLLLERRATAPRRDGCRIPQRLPLAYRVCEHWFGAIAATTSSPAISRPAIVACASPGQAHPADQPRPPPAPRSHREASRDDRLEQPVPEGGNHDPAERCSAARGGDLPGAPQGDRFAVLAREPAARPAILFLGRVAREKGIHLAYRALARLASSTDSMRPWSSRTRHESTRNRARSTRAAAWSGRPHRASRRARLRWHRRGARGGPCGGNTVDLAGARGAGLRRGSPGPGADRRLPERRDRRARSRPAGRPALRGRRCRWLRGAARGDVGRSGFHPGPGRQRLRAARGLSFQPYVEATDRFLDRTMRAFDGPDQ